MTFGGKYLGQLTVVAVEGSWIGESLVVELVDQSYLPDVSGKCVIVLSEKVLLPMFGPSKDPVGMKLEIVFPRKQEEGVDEGVTMLICERVTHVNVSGLDDIPQETWLDLCAREQAWQEKKNSSFAGRSPSVSSSLSAPVLASSAAATGVSAREDILEKKVANLEALLFALRGPQQVSGSTKAAMKAAKKAAKKAFIEAQEATFAAHRAERLAALAAELDAAHAKKKPRNW